MPRLTIEQVYADHFRYVWRCLKALGLSESVLDDAVHDVFLVVQQKLDDFDGGVAVTTWLYAILLRVARRYRREHAKDRARYVTESDAPPQSGTSAPIANARSTTDLDRTLEHEQDLLLARRALAALDDDKREVFVLLHVEEMSAPEVARISGLPLNTVYSRARAARLAFEAEVARLRLLRPGKRS